MTGLGWLTGTRSAHMCSTHICHTAVMEGHQLVDWHEQLRASQRKSTQRELTGFNSWSKLFEAQAAEHTACTAHLT